MAKKICNHCKGKTYCTCTVCLASKETFQQFRSAVLARKLAYKPPELAKTCTVCNGTGETQV